MTASMTRSGRWIPWAFVGGFAVVFAANAAMVAFAVGSWTGMETEDAWRNGIAYNRALEAARAQEALGWQVSLRFAPTAPLAGRLEAVLLDRDGAPLDDAMVSASLVRPLGEGHDREVVLQAEGGGRYVARIELPLAGQWEARLAASGPAGSHRLDARFVVR
jgi:nitrogen fixation protein FixH